MVDDKLKKPEKDILHIPIFGSVLEKEFLYLS